MGISVLYSFLFGGVGLGSGSAREPQGGPGKHVGASGWSVRLDLVLPVAAGPSRWGGEQRYWEGPLLHQAAGDWTSPRGK